MIFGPEDDEPLLDEDFGGEEDQQHEGDDLDDAGLDGADGESGDDIGDVDQTGDADEVEREDEVAARPRSRAKARVEAALREAKAAREDARLAREEAAAARTSGHTADETRREAELLANMDPFERREYEANKRFQSMEQNLARIEFRSVDANDKADFAAKAARTPALAAIADDVEKALGELRAKGQTAPRETIATYLLGQRALQRAAGARTRASKAGAERIARQTARPTGARSDVRAEAPRGDNRSARAKRLEGLTI